MVALGQQTEISEPVDPFEFDGPSPLPEIANADSVDGDPVASAERKTVAADQDAAATEARIQARFNLADAWLRVGAIGPALEALRQATTFSGTDARVLERMAGLLSRTGAHRDAGEAYTTLARASRTTVGWFAAARAYARAEASDELEKIVSELLARFQDDLPAVRFALEVVRAMPGSPLLVPRLVSTSKLALRRGDATLSHRCAVDAWVESRGSVGGEPVAESLLARGDAKGAFVLAIDAAARAFALGPAAGAGPLLAIAARAARAVGSLHAEIAILTASAVMGADRTVREGVRDLLSEQGRVLDYAARLRSDARRELDPRQCAAAWKGVAAAEMIESPLRSADALGFALIADPTDSEAIQSMREFAANPAVEPIVRDALSWATRAELSDRSHRAALSAMLGELEERAGDPAAALVAYSRAWKAGDASALRSIERVTAAGELLFAQADLALAAVEMASKESRSDALNDLLTVAGNTPGAVRDLSHATRVLAPFAGTDERVADFWLKVTRRLGDTQSLAGTLRRIATRSTARASRARATVELAELLDCEPEAQSEAVEVLEQLLDEQPQSLDAIASLVAIAEHSDNPGLSRIALLATARVESDPLAREVLLRLLNDPSLPPESRFSTLIHALDEAPGLRERASALKDLIALLGEAPSLLARRTRALLAQPGNGHEGLESAKHFAELLPLSPEATIAWFGAAGILGDADQLENAAVAVVHSLATARDASSVARAAVTRLFSLGEGDRGIHVAREAAESLGLADRGLRGSILEYAQQQGDPSIAVQILESGAAAALEAPGEALSILRRIAQYHRSKLNALGEAYALRRILVHAPADHPTLTRLAELLPTLGDERALSRVLSLQLASETDPTARREAYLTLASLQARGGDITAAAITLDRYVEERGTLNARADVMRALRAIGAHDAAVQRLSDWAEKEDDDRTAMWMHRAAARILRERDGSPARVLALVRSGLAREPEAPELLLLAEEIAKNSGAVRPMLEIYGDLDELAAGEHGRQALAYRRAAFLESVGEKEEALAVFLELFERKPVSGALRSAIERLALGIERPDVLVMMFRRLAETSSTNDAKVKFFLEAARIARESVHDRRGALELGLLAHDVMRDEATSKEVIEIARSIKPLDPHVFRAAVETVADRTLQIADEIWDDDVKRQMAFRTLEIVVIELSDSSRAVKSAQTFFKASEDAAQARDAVHALLDRSGATPSMREALLQLPGMRTGAVSLAPPAKREVLGVDALRAQITELARTGDIAGAILKVREGIAAHQDESLRTLAEDLAHDGGDAAFELELIDHRLDRIFDTSQRRAHVIRAAELLAGPLQRADEARRRLETALAREPDNDDLIRGLHDVAEQLGAWDSVSALLAKRIARATDRAEIRALRLHRAAVLEQRLEDPDGARTELEAVLEDEPAHRAALRYLADLYVRDGHYYEAGECFARAAATTQVRAEAADLLVTAGESFAKGLDEVAAETQFRSALELDPRSTTALRALSDLAQRRGDWGSLERTLLLLSEGAENEHDRVALKLAAVRAALEAGGLYRAKGHLDSVRKAADPDLVAQLDAVLQDARDNDRPISRPQMQAVNPATVTPLVAALPSQRATLPPADLVDAAPRRDTPAQWIAAPRVVPQSIVPTPPPPPIAVSEDAEEAIPLVARPPRKSPIPPPSESSLEAVKRPSSHSLEVIETADIDIAPVIEESEDVLRELVARGDADAMAALASQLARTEQGRSEAIRLERQRFNLHPSRIDALGAIVGLYRVLDRPAEARAVQSVLDVLSGRESSTVAPPLSGVPDPPTDGAQRVLVPSDLVAVAEIGTMVWEALGNVYRRDLASYGVTGVDRVSPAGATEVSRLYVGAGRLLGLTKTGLFVRAEVQGGAIPARTQPPSVILATPLANDSAVSRYVIGSAIEATRSSVILAGTLDPDERATLVRAINVAFGASGVMAGAPPAAARLAHELIASLTPRAQRRLQELVAELDAQGTPYSEERWLYSSEISRARAGLLVSGDFGVAARMVVARHRGGGGEPDVKAAVGTLEPLRDLARFAISEQYLLWRWQDSGSYGTWR